MAALQQQLKQNEIDARTRGQSIEHFQQHFANTLHVGRGKDDGQNVMYDMDKENYDELNEKGEPMRPGYSFFDKPILPKMKCRSANAIVRAENEIEAIDRKIRLIEEQRLAHQTFLTREKRNFLTAKKHEVNQMLKEKRARQQMEAEATREDRLLEMKQKKEQQRKVVEDREAALREEVGRSFNAAMDNY